MEYKQFEFELPRKGLSSKNAEELSGIAQKILNESNEGWIADNYFSSQKTFFSRRAR